MYLDDVREVASLNNLSWNKLSGATILVTGATGLIGSCLIDILMNRLDKDYVVYASGRNGARAKERFKDYWNDANFHFLAYDVTEPLDVDVQFDYVIYAASGASPHLYATDPVGIMKSNILGVDNILSYLVNHHGTRLLYVSSGEVYGEGDGSIFSEKYSGYVDSMTLRACYPSSKRASETLCIAYSEQYRLEVVVARPCHVYGPNFTESDTRAYAQFIRNVLKGEDIVMKSSGEQFRSWCYVVDCASALMYILLNGENGSAYNIADSNSNITIKQLAEMIAEIGGKQVKMIIPDDAEVRGYNVVTKSVFSTEKLQSLGWEVRGNMYSKMQSTINEIKKS